MLTGVRYLSCFQKKFSVPSRNAASPSISSNTRKGIWYIMKIFRFYYFIFSLSLFLKFINILYNKKN